MSAGRVLVVEDDEELGNELVRMLSNAAFAVKLVRDGSAALEVDPNEHDLVLLDLMLPGAYGLDVLKRFRAKSEVPILVLTARDHSADKVRGLALGADDYVTKPFWPEELLARIRARLRRPALGKPALVVRAGDIAIDLDAHRVTVGGAAIELTRVEQEIVEALARQAGRPVARSVLADHVLDFTRGGNERTLDVHVSRLRKKLGNEGRRVATVWGIGYRLETES